MLEDILRKTVTKAQPAEKFNQLRVHGGQPGAGDSIFASAHDRFVDFLRHLGHDFLDACWMDAAILNEACHGFARDLTAYRIETGQDDRVRCIIDQDGDAGGRFKGTNITTLTTDDTAL